MRGSLESSNFATIGSAISKTQRSLFPKSAQPKVKKLAKKQLEKSSKQKSQGSTKAPAKQKIIKPDHPAKKKPEVVRNQSSKQFLGYSDTSHLPATPLD